jgi:diaminohydroxyphosphoribosylaminopyrimidine deaminase/5-amino-6-(5-phosphoribosylamino)uracil reductase
MRRCLELAGNGRGSVAPNPLVGAVLVADGSIIAEGFHKQFGGPHAEVNAIATLSDRTLLERSTLYVNLEPCSHFGKTAPCADLIVESRIPRVVVGCADIFEEVRGRGILKLQRSGVDVLEGVLAREALLLNCRFFTRHAYRRPYVILKWAATSDGYIARTDHTSKWISSDASRARVHEWRAVEDAILVGTATARHDNPALTVRMTSGRNPLRIVIDRHLALSPNLTLFDGNTETLVFNSLRSERRSANVELVKIDDPDGFVPSILQELYQRRISSLIVEGGSRTLSSFIEADAWDEARVFESKAKFGEGIPAPPLPHPPLSEEECGGDILKIYMNHWTQDLVRRQFRERGYT